MNLYTTVYNMCTQKPPHDYSAELYARYGEAFSIYNREQVRESVCVCVWWWGGWACLFLVFDAVPLLHIHLTLTHTPPSHPHAYSQVLPSLQGQHGDFLLTEMWTRWSNTRVMQRWLARFFNYLDR